MRRIRRHLTFANVASALALFIAVSGGTAVALSGSNTVFTDDIANDTQPASGGNPAGGLVAADLRPTSVGTSEVANGQLNDEDVSQGTFVNFLASIKPVGAHNCGYNTVTGVNAAGDHLVLTPSYDASPGIISYTAEYAADGTVRIKACNPTDFAYGAHTTRFNLLVIDAQ
jgi:uncharacterized iron-regulated membrane protein